MSSYALEGERPFSRVNPGSLRSIHSLGEIKKSHSKAKKPKLPDHLPFRRTCVDCGAKTSDALDDKRVVEMKAGDKVAVFGQPDQPLTLTEDSLVAVCRTCAPKRRIGTTVVGIGTALRL